MADASKDRNEKTSSQGETETVGEGAAQQAPTSAATPSWTGFPIPGLTGLPGSMPGAPGTVTPPMAPGQALQLLIHQGMAVPQQNPEVVKHVTAFLSHDSDNKLQAMKSAGERSHTFRLAALGFLVMVVLLTFLIPLVALYRGDMQFVTKFMDDYMRYFIVTGLALLAGAKLPDFFK